MQVCTLSAEHELGGVVDVCLIDDHLRNIFEVARLSPKRANRVLRIATNVVLMRSLLHAKTRGGHVWLLGRHLMLLFLRYVHH